MAGAFSRGWGLFSSAQTPPAPATHRSYEGSAGVCGEQAARRSLLVAALRLLQRVGEALDGQGLEDDASVALQGGQGEALAAEHGVHQALAVEAADALDAVLDALLEGDDAAGVDLDAAAEVGRVEVDEVSGAGDDHGAAAGELLQDEALAAATAGPAALEGDTEVDGGLGGDERVLLREPRARAVQLQGAHLAGQDAREADGALAAGGREVLERQGLARE